MPGYYQTIVEHYSREAENHGDGQTCGMADLEIRRKETTAILRYVSAKGESQKRDGDGGDLTICDFGCGNGHTLRILSDVFPNCQFVGVEPNDKLYSIAKDRHYPNGNVEIVNGDLRHSETLPDVQLDVAITQRVLINILDPNDQIVAARNIVELLKASEAPRRTPWVIFIESFIEPLGNLNVARNELELPSLEPQYHNLYLPEDFFNSLPLEPNNLEIPELRSNFLSTHYFIARVLYPLLREDKAISRNSELVNFFTEGLGENIGDYSPLKIRTFSFKSSMTEQ